MPPTSCDGEARLLERDQAAAREGSGKGGNRQEDGGSQEHGRQSTTKTTTPTEVGPTLEQMDDHASKLDTGSNSNGHLEEVF